MGRDIESNDRSESPRGPAERSVPPSAPEIPLVLSRERESVQERGCMYQLSPAQRATLADIGRFRTLAADELLTYRYQGRSAPFEEDLRGLSAQGLLQRRTVWTDGKGQPLTVVVLTKRGKNLVQHQGWASSGQSVYCGFVKLREVHHDAAIYRMYQAEAAKIVQAGGQIKRVVLDYELKRNVYQPLAKARTLPPLEYARQQSEIARQNRLKVVRGKILLPDLRIEYATRSGASESIDLELATRHYRAGMMRGKAEAGFKMYAPSASVAGLTAAFDPEFAAQIFSF